MGTRRAPRSQGVLFEGEKVNLVEDKLTGRSIVTGKGAVVHRRGTVYHLSVGQVTGVRIGEKGRDEDKQVVRTHEIEFDAVYRITAEDANALLQKYAGGNGS